MVNKFRLLVMIAKCSHTISLHKLDLVIWSRLPEDVLEVVFAKLPTSGIQRLRCLSTCWKCIMEKIRYRFREDVWPYLQRWLQVWPFWMKLYNMDTNKWHLFKFLMVTNQKTNLGKHLLRYLIFAVTMSQSKKNTTYSCSRYINEENHNSEFGGMIDITNGFQNLKKIFHLYSIFDFNH
jgi:hypothetical protein